MTRIVLKSSQVEEEVNGKTGAVMRLQTFGLDLLNGYFLPFRVGLGNKPAFKEGEYTIDPKSFGLDQYGKLTLKPFVDLIPVPAHAPAPAKG